MGRGQGAKDPVETRRSQKNQGSIPPTRDPMVKRPEEGRQISEVVGMEVGDGQMREPPPWLLEAVHPVERAGAAVHEEAEVRPLHQVGGGPSGIVGEEDPGTQDGDTNRCAHPPTPPAAAVTSASSRRTPTMELTPGSSMVTP